MPVLPDLARRIAGVRGARSLAIALTTLVLTVGVALAAGPPANPGNGHGHSADHGNPHSSANPGKPGSSEAPDAETPDEDASGNGHGALVSTAARMATPAGFANHGAFVSCVAHMKDVTLATIDWSSVTPESCAAAKSDEDGD